MKIKKGYIFYPAIVLILIAIGWKEIYWKQKIYSKNNIHNLFKDELLSKIQKGKYIIVNVINPYDCLACGSMTKYYISQILPKTVIPKQNIFVITTEIRKVELDLMMKNLNIDTLSSKFLPDDALYSQINKQIPNFGGSSFFIIYNSAGERVLVKSFKTVGGGNYI